MPGGWFLPAAHYQGISNDSVSGSDGLDCSSVVLESEFHTFVCVLQLSAGTRPQKCILLCI